MSFCQKDFLMENNKIMLPDAQFEKDFEEMMTHLCEAMHFYENIAHYNHNFTFEQIIEKAKRRNKWIPYSFDAF